MALNLDGLIPATVLPMTAGVNPIYRTGGNVNSSRLDR